MENGPFGLCFITCHNQHRSGSGSITTWSIVDKDELADYDKSVDRYPGNDTLAQLFQLSPPPMVTGKFRQRLRLFGSITVVRLKWKMLGRRGKTCFERHCYRLATTITMVTRTKTAIMLMWKTHVVWVRNTVYIRCLMGALWHCGTLSIAPTWPYCLVLINDM